MNWRTLLDRLFGRTEETTAIIDAAERVGSGFSRRQFLKTALAGAAIAATVDVEQLLWMPGEKTIFLPTFDDYELITPDWVTREALDILQRQIALTSRFSRAYDEKFPKIGDTVNVRVPMRFTPFDNSGRITDYRVPVTIDAYDVALDKFLIGPAR